MYDDNEQNSGLDPEENNRPAPEEQGAQQTNQPAPAQIPPYGGYYQGGGQYRSNYQQQRDEYNWNLNHYGDYNNNGPKKPKNKKGAMIATIVVCCALFVSAIGFGIAGLNALVTNSDPKTEDTSSKQAEEVKNIAPELIINNKPTNNSDIIDNTDVLSGERVYEKVSPSVVGVVVYSSKTNTSPSGEGSGIILSADGYIVTNEHVIDGAQLIEVVLNNNERYTAKLMGYDKQTDLAAIKIDADNLIKAELGNSEELRPGETVYAVGNPGGMEFANSITQGIVSGVDRLLTNSSTGYVMTCIQTTAAINPGNSGGALVDSYGRVVGISVAKLSSVSYEGMGFALPISGCVDLIDDLINYGYIKGRPLLGITYSTISSAAANFYGVPAGLRVQTLDPESDAYAKGLKTGDIITAINGEDVTGASDVLSIMSKCKAGDTIKLTVYRRQHTAELSVKLGENNGRDTSNYVSTDGSSQSDYNDYNYNDDDFFGNPFGGFFPFE